MLGHSLLLSVCCSFVLAPAEAPATGESPVLTVSLLPAAVQFHVDGPEQPFVGVVIGSLSSDLSHFLVGLPPLLTDAVVLDFGLGDAEAGYTAALPESGFPAGIFVYAQGVTLTDGAIQSSNVADFVLDGSAGAGPVAGSR